MRSQNAMERQCRLKTPKHKKTTSVATKAILSLHQYNRLNLEMKFRNIHALVKHNRPLSDFAWLNELDMKKGLDHGETYSTRNSGTLFLENIAEVERDKTCDLMDKIRYFSLTMDGSTDDGVLEQETLFVRSSLNGKIHTKFIAIGEPNSTKSADLHSFVTETLKENNIYKHMGKCVGFGSDGAANMMGAKSGLIQLLKKDYPSIIGIHCLAHRLELAIKDALKKNKQYENLLTMLIGVYYFYKNSPKQRKALRNTFQVFGKTVKLPQRVGGSRWIPHMKRAMDVIFQCYEVYVSHLQNESHTTAKAEGLVNLMTSYHVMVFAVLLNDLLEPLMRLSLVLQRRDITVGEAQLMIATTIDVLKQVGSRPSERLTEVTTGKKFAGNSLRVRGTAANVDPTELADKLVQTLTVRYCDKENLEPTMIGCLRTWPKTPQDGYGTEQVGKLVERFADVLETAGVQCEKMNSEWTFLTTLMYKSYGSSLAETGWEDVHSRCASHDLTNILSLIDMINSLPPTSVPNETAFNQLKLLKTDRRHSLSANHLNDCLLVKIESPSISEFEPTPAIDKWLITPSGRKRRIRYKRHPHVSQPESTAEITCESQSDSGSDSCCEECDSDCEQTAHQNDNLLEAAASNM